MATEPNGTTPTGSSIQDHRQKPRGVLPRQLQMWLMVGIAVVMLLIIMVTGHSQPAPGPGGSGRLPPRRPPTGSARISNS